MSETVRFGVSLDAELLKQFDRLIAGMGYENRSEAIRDLIREKLVEEEWQAPHEETFAAAFIVYDHHTMSVADRLTDLQHEFFQNIVATLHVHIDQHNCLEVVAMRGTGERLRSLGERLVSLRGVKYGKLNMGTSGRKVH